MEGARQFTQAGNNEETKRHSISAIQASLAFINGELKVSITLNLSNAASPKLGETPSLDKEDKHAEEKEPINL